MILGVGHDVVDTERVARALASHGRRFEDRVYTAAERAQCARRADRVEALAGRFAAKEAFFKALGTGLAPGLSFQQVEVAQRDGRPALRLRGRAAREARKRGVRTIHLSLSHQPRVAAAVVILEG